MTFILSYSSLANTKNQIKTRFGGSSKYRVNNGELIEINRKKEKEKRENLSSQTQTGNDASNQTDEELNKKTYKINKSKVKKNCHALSRLEKSKKFLAFYTITFPVGLSDSICYKLFNTWLTRCRKNSGLNTYLWVAERQKNETMHYHLLTNDFMPIKAVNRFMGISLANEKENGSTALKEIYADKYNGVDVKRVGKKRNSIISYLTKYVTKNNNEYNHFPWHCSRDVSRLFTSINFEKDESEQYFSKLPSGPENYITHCTEYVKIDAFKFRPNEELFVDLNSANESIYNI